MKRQHKSHALSKIQKQFPQVKKVVDSSTGIMISVGEYKLVPKQIGPVVFFFLFYCHYLQKIADGAIIGVSSSYLIRGDKAIRFRTPPSVAREIVSFDRHHDFASGKDYSLAAVPESQKLENQIHRGGTYKGNKGQQKRIYHKTSNIRSLKQD